MSSRVRYRRHSTAFKLQLCQEIRSGLIGRREAATRYDLLKKTPRLRLVAGSETSSIISGPKAARSDGDAP